jgi:O-antigen ligase
MGALFYINYDRSARTSKALWIPIVWLLIALSRAPAAWFKGPGDTMAGAGEEYIEGNPFERNIFSAIIALATVVLLMRGGRVGKFVRANGPIVAFVLYCGLSLLWSDFPTIGFKRWTKLLGDLEMVLIVLTDREPAAAVDRVFTRVAFTLIPLSVLLNRYFPDLGRTYEPASGRMFFTGVTTNKNTFGMLCMIVGLYCWWRTLEEWQNRKARGRHGPLLANGFILLLSAYLLYVADSATSKSCLYLCGGIIAVVKLFRFGRKPAVVHLLVAGAVGISVSALFFTGSLLGNLGRNSTLTGRTELWSEVLTIPVSRLVGAGYESFWLGDRLNMMWRLSGQAPVQAHDGYLEILVNLGWVGIIFLAALIIHGYCKIMQRLRRDPQRECLALAFFVSALIYNLTEAAFKMSDPVWIFFVWAIMATKMRPLEVVAASSVKTSTAASSPTSPTSLTSNGSIEESFHAI